MFGYDCEFFGELLYLYMARGYDRVKISLLRFLECMMPIFDKEMRLKHNKIAFKILDLDRDNTLNTQNLLHLQQNISPKTILGQEIFKMMDYQIKHNLHNKNSYRKEHINYDVFAKVIKKSVIVDELRDVIF